MHNSDRCLQESVQPLQFDPTNTNKVKIYSTILKAKYMLICQKVLNIFGDVCYFHTKQRLENQDMEVHSPSYSR